MEDPLQIHRILTILESPETKPYIQEKTLKVGEMIYHEGEKPKALYFLKEGLAALVNISANGAESLLRIFTPLCFFGHRAIFEEGVYHGNMLALKKSKVLIVETEHALEMIYKNPDLCRYFLKVISQDLKAAELRLRDMASKKVESRIIESLIFLKSRNPEHPWTRREIGEFAGAKMETVSRVLTKLENQNLIKKTGRLIEISDVESLLKKSDGV
jgi:CRP-like cAMP-binding protein